jgi:hypothetical protein
MEIGRRTVIVCYFRQRKGGKKIHRKLSGMYGEESYSLGALKYWVRELRVQWTDLHDETWPGRPSTDVSAQIAWLLNDEQFSSTRYLARQLAINKGLAKRNLQEIMGFYKLSLERFVNLLSANQKAARVARSREWYNILLLEQRNNVFIIITRDKNWYCWSYSESSMWELSWNGVPTRPFQKINSKKFMLAIFFARKKLMPLDYLPKRRNMDSHSFCNAVLEGIKAGTLAGTQKSTLRNVQIWTIVK